MYHSYRVLIALAVGGQLIRTAQSQETCGNLIKAVTFEGTSRIEQRVPYVETFAYQDWAPYSYLDGFFGDDSTRGNVNDRAFAVSQGDSRYLEVKLPEGCVTSMCAMQTKSALLMPTESATLKFKMRFGPKFDWVRGGKLPGLCGGRCLTGCKEVTGLDGWSSRQMWRPCVWPPEHEDNSINCEGGKVVAYVYHMFKEHWCGDDFEYSNELWARQYRTNREPVVPKDFFQPNPDEWYTIWSHVKMNTAGPPDEAQRFERDGVLQTWLEGPGFGPLLVVDRQDMSWRRYNNVSIDTLYFSVFFGGSSPSFRAKKDETIDFDDFQIWEGRCAPMDEPFSQKLTKPVPIWPAMRTDLDKPTTLQAAVEFDKAFVGGGCADFAIKNQADVPCDDFELELNIRPDWGKILDRGGSPNLSGLTLLDSDAAAGWFLLKPEKGLIEAGRMHTSSGVCVRNYQSAKYVPEDLNVHVVAFATCIAGPAASVRGSNQNTLEAPDPPPVIQPTPKPSPANPAPSNDNWCQTTTPEGGIWDLFSTVKTMLCSDDSDFDKPWASVDVNAVTCPMGQAAIFPDNACIDNAAWL
eukprot:jgi/Ulvmu1/606/UM001_0614.1